MPKTPELLLIDSDISFEAGKCKTRIPVTVPVTAEGLYNGNGQCPEAKDKILPITGFNKLTGEWFGKHSIEEEKNSL